MHFGKYKMSMIHYFKEFIMKAYIIHENDEWTLPLKEQLQKLSVPFEDWHMAKVNLNTASVPPVGVFYNRMSASSHSRGHLGDFNELMLSGTLAGVELGLRKAKIPHKPGGLMAAIDYLAK
jgi:hypothetical protein